MAKKAHEDKPMMLPRMYSTDEIVVNEFTEESAQIFRDKLLETAKGDPQEPVVVYIDSWAGEVYALAKMIETMDEVPNPIVTVAMGKAMSCGAILLSHGDVRFCGKHSRVMIHEVSAGTMGDVHDMKAHVNESLELNQHFLDLFAKNCGLKGYDSFRTLVKSRDGRDIYMDPTQAKKFGLVDFIGLPAVRRAMMYKIEVLPEKRKLCLSNKPKKKSETKT